MMPIRRLLALIFDPRPRPQPKRLAPTLAQIDDEPTTVIVRLAELRACRP